jgi:hypothetical protein
MGFEKPTSKCAASFLAKPFSHALQDHRHCDSPEINWVPQKPVPGKKKSGMPMVVIWQCVKTLYPCSSHQNSW